MRPPTAEQARGTRVALAFPALAIALGFLWASGHGWASGLTALETGVFLAAVALAEQVELSVSRRTIYTFSTPIMVLAALLGGPLTGLLAGMLAGIADLGAVWRRRLAYAGLCGLQGYAAGLVGLHEHDSPATAMVATVAAMLVVACVSLAGRALIFWDRGAPVWRNTRNGAAAEVVETVVAAPMLALLTVSFADAPFLVLSTIAALLVGLGLLHAMRVRHATELSAALGTALTDSLTGAPNRLAFEDALEREHARIVRGALPAGLFLVDVDRFKSVNDRYGHPVGDRVLVEVVERLRSVLRRGDLVARWGGEELAVLAPGLAEPEAVGAFGERLRAAVADEPITVVLRSIRVTVSVGGTLLDGSIVPDRAVVRADRALYRAKGLRNDVVVDVPSGRRRPGLATG
jgi:diguanylate cyclase (GGDEF)-like protein